MGYDIHLIRKQDWSDDDGAEITFEEWIAFVRGDPEMRLDGFAVAHLENGVVLRTEDPSIAVWMGHPEHGQRRRMAWMNLWKGSVTTKNPDEPTLKKMWEIAQVLHAKVQGDEGEIYDSGGVATWQAYPTSDPPRKPWWRFW